MEVDSVGKSVVEDWVELEKTDKVVVGVLTFTQKRVKCIGVTSQEEGEGVMFVSGVDDDETQYTTATFPEYKGYSLLSISEQKWEAILTFINLSEV